MPRKSRSTRKPRQRQKASVPSGELELPLPDPDVERVKAGLAKTLPGWAVVRQVLGDDTPQLGNEEDDALLAAALKRLRARSTLWVPPLLEVTPMALLGWCAILTARDWNDPELERAGLKLMGYRLH